VAVLGAHLDFSDWEKYQPWVGRRNTRAKRLLDALMRVNEDMDKQMHLHDFAEKSDRYMSYGLDDCAECARKGTIGEIAAVDLGQRKRSRRPFLMCSCISPSGSRAFLFWTTGICIAAVAILLHRQ
jgi:hypothetical protein